MKSVLVKFREKTIRNLALIFTLSVFLTACGGEDSVDSNANDKNGPVIKINYAEEGYIPVAVVQTKSGLEYIPTSKINYQDPQTIDHNFGSYALSYLKGDGEIWAGVWLELDSAIDPAQGKVITAKIHSTEPREITLKLEPSLTELTVQHPGDGHKVLEFDFSATMQPGDTKLTFINDKTVKGTGNAQWLVYIDDISQKTSLESSNVSVLSDFDDVTKNYRVAGFGGGEANIVEAPDSPTTIRVDGSIIGYHETHILGTPYIDPGAEANDNYTGYIPNEFIDREGTVNQHSPGTHTIIYTATDGNKNKTQLTRYITMIDITAPSISFGGHKDIIVGLGSTFTDSGVTAEDNIPDNIDESKTTTTIYKVVNGENIPVTEIETDEIAHFKIDYSFTDTSGNTQISTRNVFVRNAFSDQIKIFENGTINLATWDNGIMAFDQGIGYDACNVSAGCPNINWSVVTDTQQNSQVLEIEHLDTPQDAGLFISSKTGVDIRGPNGAAAVAKTGLLQLDIKRQSGSDPYVDIWADCGYPCAGGASRQGPFVTGEWTRIYIPVSEIMTGATSTLDLSIVRSGLLFRPASIRDAVYRIDNVTWLCETTCAGDNTPHTSINWADTHEDLSLGFEAPTSYDGYTLVWSDEFNGNMVNPANWDYDIGTGPNGDGWGNGELQYYREENASVDNGMLIIEAAKHFPKLEGDIGYTSAKLKTEDLFEFKYGRVDARAVAAKGLGLWSAIWMLGANYSEVGWPRSGEIDILDTIAGNRDGLPQEAMLVNNMYWNATGSSPEDTLSLGSINDSQGTAEYWLHQPEFQTDENGNVILDENGEAVVYERPLPWDVDNLPEWMAGPTLDNPATPEVEEIRPLLLTGCEDSTCIDTDGSHKTPVDVDNLPTWITDHPDWTDWIADGGSTETFSNTFHVFSLIWTENKITFEVDGVKTNEIEITGALTEHYRQTFFLILNVAIGGNWPKAPSETTAFSDGMLVDYVRVYQVDSDGDGTADHDWDGETELDAFPDDASESMDTDGDGVGDNADTDPSDPGVQ